MIEGIDSSPCSFAAASELTHRRHIDIHADVKMRRALFALGHALADDAAHGRERDDLLRHWHRRDRHLPGRTSCGAEHIRGENAAFRAAAAQRSEFDSLLFGNAFGFG